MTKLEAFIDLVRGMRKAQKHFHGLNPVTDLEAKTEALFIMQGEQKLVDDWLQIIEKQGINFITDDHAVDRIKFKAAIVIDGTLNDEELTKSVEEQLKSLGVPEQARREYAKRAIEQYRKEKKS